MKQSRIPPWIRPRLLKGVQNPSPLPDDMSPDDDRGEVPKEASNEPAHSLWELLDIVTSNDDRVRRLCFLSGGRPSPPSPS